METICADGQCLKNYLLIILNGKKTHQILMKSLYKNVMMKITNRNIFLKLMLNTLTNHHKLIYHFYHKQWKLKNVINLYVTCIIKESMLYDSHTKRNSMDRRALFIEFSEYVNNSRVVVYWGDKSFSRAPGCR